MPYFVKRLLRRPWLLLGTLAVSLLLCGAMSCLAVYRAGQSEQLEQVIDAFDIQCVVTDQKGTKSEGLRGREDILDFVAGGELSPLVRDLRVTKEFKYSSPQYGIGVFYDIGGTLGDVDMADMVGVSGPDCDTVLRQEMTWLEDGFYESSEPVCLISRWFYDLLGGGDSVRVFITDPSVRRNPLSDPPGRGEFELRVAGVYPGVSQRVYIPLGTARALASELAGRFTWDSMAFILSDNKRLDELYTVSEREFVPVNPKGSEGKYSLNIQDARFRATVSGFEQNISRVRWLMPLLSALSLLAGGIVGFLSTRNGEHEYALSRTLGLGRVKLFISVMASQLIPALPAIPLGSMGAWRQVLIYLICFAAGCLVCTIRIISTPPTAILREQE